MYTIYINLLDYVYESSVTKFEQTNANDFRIQLAAFGPLKVGQEKCWASRTKEEPAKMIPSGCCGV